MRIIWTRAALRGIWRAYDYVYDFNSQAAARMAEALFTAGDGLAKFPASRPAGARYAGARTGHSQSLYHPLSHRRRRRGDPARPSRRAPADQSLIFYRFPDWLDAGSGQGRTLASRSRSPPLPYAHSIGGTRYVFVDLATLLARASPFRSGDALAGLAAESAAERVAAQMALADLPLRVLLSETVVPYEADEVTRLIVDTHDPVAFAPIAALTVGAFREFLLGATPDELTGIRAGVTPEMTAAVSKIMRQQDLIAVAGKCRVITRFRSTIGLPGRLSVRLQPNHPTDNPRGVAASVLDGLLLGAGDAVIGVNPATDSVDATCTLLAMLDAIRDRYAIPTQTCVLAHVTTSLSAIERGAPVDLVFQSIGGTEAVNRSFGVSLSLLAEARAAALSLKRGTLGDNVMYFETGQGSALSANAHHGVDQQTVEARAYAVARAFDPLLVNTVVGFIGPEYLYDGKQITRAGLEDHFCGKLLGLPMGVDVCYTNHAEADQDDMDALLTLLGVAGVTYVMGVPGADDVMLSYQSTSFHDALYLRGALGLRPAPEFEDWLARVGIAGPVAPERFPEGLSPALIGLA